MFSLPWDTWLRLIVWLVVGVLVYAGYGRKNSRTRNAGQNGRASGLALN